MRRKVSLDWGTSLLYPTCLHSLRVSGEARDRLLPSFESILPLLETDIEEEKKKKEEEGDKGYPNSRTSGTGVSRSKTGESFVTE